MREIIDKIKDNSLFLGMGQSDIQHILECSHSKVRTYDKHQKIFSQEDPPKSLYILISGSIVVCRDSLNGKRYIVTNIEENEMFGEVYVFLDDEEYPYYALTNADSKVLEIPKSFFFHYCEEDCKGHNLLLRNMLKILAKKAFFLNNKVQLLSHGNLRQKIAKYLLEQVDETMYVKLNMNREELADYLSVARPSLSRELKNMEKDGLIEADRDIVRILNYGKLLECVEGIEH